jgi:creatinine amidohydrolase
VPAKKLINWIELPYQEISKLNKDKVVIFAVGSIEPHGKHLPLGTDYFIPDMIAREVCKRTGSIYAPAIPYGLAQCWKKVKGTLTLRAETLADLVEDLIESFYDQGFRRFLIIDGHGDNYIGYDLAFYRLIKKYKDIILKSCCWYHKDFVTVSKKLKYDVMHADKAETEMILLYAKDLVIMKKARDYKCKLPISWVPDLKKLLPHCVCGEPTKANLKDAKKLFGNIVKVMCGVVRRLERSKN